MKRKLWEKNSVSLDKSIEHFTVGTDYLLDQHLALFDLYGSAAHVRMLDKIGIISSDELDAILAALKKIKQEIQEGSFQINLEDEDVHTKVENILVSHIGVIGKKIHTARSRNDQVLVDTRLYTKAQMLSLAQTVLSFCDQLLSFAQDHEFIPMPGYTHMQIAMPSSIGMWASAFVENLLDDLKLLTCIYDVNDMNPLGSGAGYGTSLDIDREYTTELLGFNRVQKNSIYCGNSRGKMEANILSVISSFALILNRIAADLLLFTTKEFNFFTFSNSVATGSSIMPQKRNLDVMELVRGRTHQLLSNESQMKQIIANLPSGYNRDYQDTKRLLIQSFDIITQMFDVSGIVFRDLKPNTEALILAFKPEIYATDAAYRLVKEGVPFRDAYRQIGENIGAILPEDPVANIKSKNHLGSTGNLQLDGYKGTIQEEKEKWLKKNEVFDTILSKLL